MSHSPTPLLSRLAVAALGLAAAAGLAAQEPSELFLDAVDVSVVNVEVVVTDADGNPVTGLGPEDFEVYEDGKPVEVTNFYAVDRRAAATPQAADAASLELLPQDATRQLHLVLLVDQPGLQPQNRAALFTGLRDDVDRAFALDGKVMVAALDRTVEIVVPFTDDRDRVLTALDGLADDTSTRSVSMEQRAFVTGVDTARLPPPPDISGDSAMDLGDINYAITNALRLMGDARTLANREVMGVRASVAEVSRFVDGLSGLPGRKAVLFLSDGIPRRPADFLVEVWRERFDEWLDASSAFLSPGDLVEKERFLHGLSSSDYDTSNEVAALTRHAAAQRVAFYPISPGTRSVLQATRNLFSNATATMDAMTREETMIEIAAETGGVAWTRSTAIGDLIDRVAADFASFYSLGYEQPLPDVEGYRKIRVEVRGDGLRVRHPDGYRTRDPLERLRDLTLASLHYGVDENPLEIALARGEAEAASGKRSLVPLLVQIPYRNILLLPQEGVHKARLKLVLIVKDAGSGATSEPREIDLPVEIPNQNLTQILSSIAVYPLQLNLEPGAKKIAVGIRDELSRVDATASLEIEVGATVVGAAGG